MPRTMTSEHTNVGETPIPFLLEAGKLKQTKRTGWLRFVSDVESVADHTFRVALLAFLAPAELDPLRCTQMALVHDLAESIIGDIPLYAQVPKEEKHKLEKLAIEYLQSLLPCDPVAAAKLKSLWLEYESGASPEAAYVKSADKFECLIQAYEYEKKTFGKVPGLEEFQGLNSKCTAPAISSWAQVLRQLREEQVLRRQQQQALIFIIGQSDQARAEIERVAFDSDLSIIDFQILLHSEAKNDKHYSHSQVLREYVAANCALPSTLCVSLLEDRIRTGGQDEQFLIIGFPVTALEQFALLAQHHVYVVKCGELESQADSQYGVAQSTQAILSRLTSTPRYFEVAADGTKLTSAIRSVLHSQSHRSKHSSSDTEWTIEAVLAQHNIKKPSPDSLTDFFSFASRLKQVKRSGWLRYGINAESIADHSCLMALLTFALPEGVNSEKCTRMCLIHDLAEVLVGDINPFSGVARGEKMRREGIAFSYIAHHWPSFGVRIKQLWEEFEVCQTAESQYANDLDKIEMMLQAFEYEKQYGLDLSEFFGAARKLVTMWGQSKGHKLLQDRNDWRSSNSQTTFKASLFQEENVQKLQDEYYG